MKYKKGSIVEVLITDEVPYHSWRPAQIVSGNGHNYTVKYDVYPGFTNEGKVGRVSRKFLRPCPPMVEISKCWPGDVVEVFHDFSWKMAIVSKAFNWDVFLVRLVGSFLEFEANKSELRVRQSWQNHEWVVIGKAHIDSEGQCNKLEKHNLLSRSQFGAQNENLPESHIVSTRTLKRGSPYCFSQDEVNVGPPQKFRFTQKEGKRLRMLLTSPEKVDAIPSSRNMLPEPNDDDSVTSSVGSCSINRYMRCDMRCKSDSDAESVCHGGIHEDLSLCNKELAAEIHRLELQAYRHTLEALHASGPLSWEKETMVTNLRMSLHITNDEHLIELKNLISSHSR